MPNYFTELKGGPSGPSYKVKDEASTSAIEAIINVNGCCNILPYIVQSTASATAIFTVNNDGSVTVNGTPTSSYPYITYHAGFTVKAGTYIIDSGVPAQSSVYVNLKDSGGNTIANTYDGKKEFTLASDTVVVAYIYLHSMESVSNFTIYPMLYDARLNPTGYVPYAMTNRELTDNVTANAEAIDAITDVYSAKNMFHVPDRVHHGITFTDNGVNGYHVSGTSDGARAITDTGAFLPYGTYKFSGFEGKTTKIKYIATEGSSTWLDVPSDGIVNNSIYAIALWVDAGVSNLDETIYPMLQDARVKSTAWVPWTMTNLELTKSIAGERVVVIADGVKTYAQLFNELFNAISISKVTNKSILRFDSNTYQINYISSTRLQYSNVRMDSGSSMTVAINAVRLEATNSHIFVKTLSDTIVTTSFDSSVKSSGTITLYY